MNENSNIFVQENVFETVVSNMSSILSRCHYVNVDIQNRISPWCNNSNMLYDVVSISDNAFLVMNYTDWCDYF